MNFFRKLRGYRHISLLTVFLAGFVAGIFIMNAGRRILLENTALLDEYSLYQMKYMTVDGNVFFLYVLKKRLGTLLGIVLLSSTYLGIITVFAYSGWLGISLGMLLSAAILRYGMKGLLLMITAAFPQYLLYVPAFVMLLKNAYELCASIYFPGRCRELHSAGKSSELKGWILKFLMISGVVITGALIESYVNPNLVTNLLKIF